MELQGSIAYLWKNKIIMILEHLLEQIFLGKGLQNHDVATTLMQAQKADVENTTLQHR